jgi:hypothetical protein
MKTKHQGQGVLIQTRNIIVNLWNKGTSMSSIAKWLCLMTKTISRASTSRAPNKDLGYSYKRLHKIAIESLTPENELKLVEYLAT